MAGGVRFHRGICVGSEPSFLVVVVWLTAADVVKARDVFDWVDCRNTFAQLAHTKGARNGAIVGIICC